MQISQKMGPGPLAGNAGGIPESIELVSPAGARVLLVGAWEAGLPAEFKRRGAVQVVGVSTRPVAASNGMDACHTADLSKGLELPYAPGSFDLIWIDDALERCHDPVAALQALRAFATADGRLVCHIANVRNEWVIMRLLVDGQWANEGDQVINREHVHLFTRKELDRVVEAAQLEAEGNVLALRSQPSAWLEAAADFVARLGGDVEKFRAEATVVRFVLVARPEGATAREAAGDPWDGARSTRILVAPLWNDPNDAWPDAVEQLCKRVTGKDDTTIGITLPIGGVDAVPPPLLAFARSVSADIVLLDAPSDVSGWQKLMRKAQMFVATGERPDLLDLARRTGIEIADARSARV